MARTQPIVLASPLLCAKCQFLCKKELNYSCRNRKNGRYDQSAGLLKLCGTHTITHGRLLLGCVIGPMLNYLWVTMAGTLVSNMDLLAHQKMNQRFYGGPGDGRERERERELCREV